ncbi:MAG: YIP1 family protein [Kangiellaceae bacterium]|nr:YIP1 family protein [Kangiellaceae bacterium]MCW8997343.1 YIP1 family protein [Kangiellaceae bacterium]
MTDSATNNEPNDGITPSSPSSFSIFTNIFTSPDKAFNDIKADYPVVMPMLTLIALNALLVIALYASIDFQWFVDHMVELQAGELTKSEQDQTRQAFEMMSPGMMGGIGAFSVAVVLLIVFCLQAVYFVIVSGITNDGFEFKQWLSLATWSSLPSLLGTLASFVVVFTSTNGQIAPESLNPLSLNELFFGLNALKGVGNIMASTDITMFWSIALLTLGYSNWTGKSKANSFFIVILPFAIYFGVRFLIA